MDHDQSEDWYTGSSFNIKVQSTLKTVGQSDMVCQKHWAFVHKIASLLACTAYIAGDYTHDVRDDCAKAWLNYVIMKSQISYHRVTCLPNYFDRWKLIQSKAIWKVAAQVLKSTGELDTAPKISL